MCLNPDQSKMMLNVIRLIVAQHSDYRVNIFSHFHITFYTFELFVKYNRFNIFNHQFLCAAIILM